MDESTSTGLPLSRLFADLWRMLRRDLFSSYRPELHYMRGPGPKWREKHAVPAAADTAFPHAAPATVRALAA